MNDRPWKFLVFNVLLISFSFFSVTKTFAETNITISKMMITGQLPVVISRDLTKDEALEDFNYFRLYIKQGYSNYEISKKSFNWEAYFKNTARKITSKSSWAVIDFLSLLERPFFSRVLDGHVSFIYLNSNSNPVFSIPLKPLVAWVPVNLLDDPLMVNCKILTTSHLLKKQKVLSLAGLQFRNILTSRADLSELSCHQRKIPMRQITVLTNPKPDLFYTGHNANGDLIIRIKSFSPALSSLPDQIASVGNLMGGTSHLIIDLRGNGGGNEQLYLQLLKALGVGGQVHTISNKVKASLVNDIAVINVLSLQIQLMAKTLSSADLNKLEALRLQKLNAFEDSAKHESLESNQWKLDSHGQVFDLGPKLWNGKVTLLVDRQCGSACEIAVDYSKQLGFEIIGSNTAGAIHFGESISHLLPNSSILIQLGTYFSNFQDNVILEGKGYNPSTWIDGSPEALIGLN